MTAAFHLRTGQSLAYDGELCTITELVADAVVVRDARGRLRRLRLADLLVPVSEGGRVHIPGDGTQREAPGVASGLWAEATDAAVATSHERADHVREVLTGYRSGTELIKRAGEPRASYQTDRKLLARQKAKADELGLGVRTVQRWIAQYQQSGEAGLLDSREQKSDIFANFDGRWLAAARLILEEQRGEAKVNKGIILARVRARVEQQFGAGNVKIPGRTSGYQALTELDRGRNTFGGSTKSKRSIANRPPAPYGRLTAARPGEYVLLDTTPLNVFALSPITGRWVTADLTVAIDLYSRCVLGLRLTPGSTKSIDVSGVLLEAFQPLELPLEWGNGAYWPYHGLPDAVLINPANTRVERFSRAGIVPETIVVDHGKPYLSEHVTSACARLGISIQPARLYQPTDKSPVERFFRTFDALLQQLPGYKGPDIAGRGEDPEEEAVYTIPQLEQIIREWVACCYHHRPHASLADPRLPGVKLSPAQKYEQGLTIAGTLRLPTDRNALLELLPVVMRQFNHYGVEVRGLRYNGPIVAKYRNRSRSLHRDNSQKWPFYINPADMSRIHFHDPEDQTWHQLESELATIADGPFSLDALEFAKRIAVSKQPPVPVDEALANLLERWGAGLASTPEERRISTREAAQLAAADPFPDPDGLWSLRTVQARLESAIAPPHEPNESHDRRAGLQRAQPLGGDDDNDDDLDLPGVGQDYNFEPMELM